jgi:hypothetical protein
MWSYMINFKFYLSLFFSILGRKVHLGIFKLSLIWLTWKFTKQTDENKSEHENKPHFYSHIKGIDISEIGVSK